MQTTQDAAELELSVVLPCLNEAETLASCIIKAQRALAESAIAGEVIVADNGSTDGSQDIALGLKARVVSVVQKGYGNALRGGIAAARGTYVIMGDADDSYDFGELPQFVARLRQGFDLVMGNRFQGGIKPGAMPWKNRFIGNPVLSGIGKLLFRCPCSDFHCGLRAFSKKAYQTMQLTTTGMEFASEMVIKATLLGLRISEVPATLSPDGRSRPPHLRPWRDGWRHLRFMLLYSPRWLFYYPGLTALIAGVAMLTALLANAAGADALRGWLPMLLGAIVLTVTGFNAVGFSFLSKLYALTTGLHPLQGRVARLSRFLNLEGGLILGLAAQLWRVGGRRNSCCGGG